MTLTLTCSSLAETERLGESLAMALRVGDLITLEGPLAAGKSALARACIRAALGDPAVEVPSPTFTLVQTYAPSSPPRIDHLDLYRLSDPQELDELGLDEALAEGAALVEWPSKGALPDPALAIAISMGAEDARKITIDGPALPRLQRSLALRAFIDNAGHAADARAHLTGDASTRRYEIVGSAKHVLMDAPPQADGDPLPGFGVPYSRIAHLAEDTLPFAAVAHALTAAGFAAPYIIAADHEQGFLLMENLGSAQIIDTDRQPIPDRYIASAQVLAALHAKTWAPQMPVPGTDHIHNVPAFDHRAMMIEVSLLPDWYAPFRLGRPLTQDDRSGFDAVWSDLVSKLDSAEKSLVMRDFHSPNIVWRDGQTGTDRIGLLDFQDALIGPAAYDLASLAQDARVDVSADLEAAMIDAYCNARVDFDETAFREATAIMAAQRATKVAGIFVRLSKRDGKHAYLAHLPRMEDYITRSLAHPALANYRAWWTDAFGEAA